MSGDGGAATYRGRFASPREAAAYDAQEYGAGAYASALWEIERDQLAGIVADLRRARRTIDYLDFAAGTGRVIGFLEDRVDSATGVEISPAMAERAQARLAHGRIVCEDITRPGSVLGGPYDLITAFRFVLNAEPALRLAALRALTDRLRDGDSRLVFNNHGNLWSVKAATYPLRLLREGRGWWSGGGNLMTGAHAHRLARAAGLEIVATYGCGVLGGRLAARLPRARVLAIERALAARPAPARLGINQTYVARRRAGRTSG